MADEDLMDVRAGSVASRLPAGWADNTEYVFHATDERMSLRVSSTKASTEGNRTIQEMLNERESTFQSIGASKTFQKREQEFDGRPAGLLAMKVDTGGQANLIRNLLIQGKGGVLINCVLTAPTALSAEFEAAWDSFTRNLELQ